MGDKDKKKAASEPRPPTTTYTPTDPKLAEWLQQLWNDGQQPEKIQIVQLYQRGKTLGTIVDHQPIADNEPWDAEKSVKVANRFLRAAQQDCNLVIGKPQVYGVICYDDAQNADSYRRYPIKLRPSTTAIVKAGESGSDFLDDDEEGEGEDDDSPMTGKKFIAKLMLELLRTKDKDKDRELNATEEAVIFMRTILRDTAEERKELRNWITELMSQNRAFFAETKAALDNSEDRRLARMDKELWIDMKKDGVRQVRNMLPGLFTWLTGNANGGAAPGALPNGGQNGAAMATTPTGPAPMSPIQQILDNFFADCNQLGVAVKLFGQWDADKSPLGMSCTEPGLLTPEQFLLLARVHKGVLPDEAIDNLLPDSGKATAITREQQNSVGSVLSAGAQMSILELFTTRVKAREAAAAAAEASTIRPPGATANPSPAAPKE